MVVPAIAFLVTVASCIFLWFTLVIPHRWHALVDRENAFWVRTGLVPEKWAAECKAFERGLPLKIIVGFTIAVGIVILSAR